MFETLSEHLKRGVQILRNQRKLNTSNTSKALESVREALLEADVALPVVKTFIEDVRKRVLGAEVTLGVDAGDVFIKKVQEALTHVMGDECAELALIGLPPTVILVAGLQGAGKTTTVGKLAYWLKNQQKKSVLVTSVDIYRPAAIEQLEAFTQPIEVSFYPRKATLSPLEIAQGALEHAKRNGIEVVIIDTAGRLHLDAAMMEELQQLHTALKPTETLLVIDGMMGQEASKTAQAFDQAVNVTGIILTKMEGDARGGAALSVRFTTQKPIKFIGMGEKIHALEPFYPDRIASRILGMGDIVSLVEAVQRRTDEKVTKKLTDKIKKGQGFNLQDFLNQLIQMQKLSVGSLLDKLPSSLNMPQLDAAKQLLSEKKMTQMIAIVRAMTPKERQFPHLIQGSRKRRIKEGSGTDAQAINRTLKHFEQMQKITKRFSSAGKLQKLLQRLPNSF